ncbi:hypothetical protein ID866_6252 [Astraeus odoratus]|nr:hypothetical protein ID866_6252 [Astraeus odoratus]
MLNDHYYGPSSAAPSIDRSGAGVLDDPKKLGSVMQDPTPGPAPQLDVSLESLPHEGRKAGNHWSDVPSQLVPSHHYLSTLPRSEGSDYPPAMPPSDLPSWFGQQGFDFHIGDTVMGDSQQTIPPRQIHPSEDRFDVAKGSSIRHPSYSDVKYSIPGTAERVRELRGGSRMRLHPGYQLLSQDSEQQLTLCGLSSLASRHRHSTSIRSTPKAPASKNLQENSMGNVLPFYSDRQHLPQPVDQYKIFLKIFHSVLPLTSLVTHQSVNEGTTSERPALHREHATHGPPDVIPQGGWHSSSNQNFYAMSPSSRLADENRPYYVWSGHPEHPVPSLGHAQTLMMHDGPSPPFFGRGITPVEQNAHPDHVAFPTTSADPNNSGIHVTDSQPTPAGAACPWKSEDGNTCGIWVSPDNVSKHLADRHGIKGMSSSQRVLCRACPVPKEMKRESIKRHFEEAHLHCKRKCSNARSNG